MNNKMQMICLPFAGGTKHSLRFFKDKLPGHIVYNAVEYPGHGSRIRSQSLVDLHAIVDDAFEQVKHLLSGPYCIYGHSMGAVAGYLLVRKIIGMGLPLPHHLFISGTDAPSVPYSSAPRYLLPKDEFIQKLTDLGGMPDEVLQSRDMMDFFEPILRADFQAIETYTYQGTTPFDVPITVMIGENENLDMEDVKKWQEETTQQIRIFRFPGNHFFIYDHEADICQLIEASLQSDYIRNA